MFKKLMSVTLSLVFVLFLVACSNTATVSPSKAEETKSSVSSTEEVKKYKVGFANLRDAGDLMMAIKASMVDQAAKYGVDLICVDNEYDPVKAVQNADTLVSSGVKCVIEFNGNSDANTQIKDILDAAGVYCIAIDIPVKNDKGAAPLVGVDNYKAGYCTGDNMGLAVKEKWNGKVDLYVSVETMSNGETNKLRNGAMLDALRTHVDVPDDIVVRLDAKDMTDIAQKLMADTLTAHPDCHNIVVCTHTDSETQGVYAAVQLANRQNDVLIGGIGPSEFTMKNFSQAEANCWIGSTITPAEGYGEIAIPLAMKMIDGEKVDLENYARYFWLTHDNYSEYYK